MVATRRFPHPPLHSCPWQVRGGIHKLREAQHEPCASCFATRRPRHPHSQDAWRFSELGPAVEETDSLHTDVAGTHNISLASLKSKGRRFLFIDRHRCTCCVAGTDDSLKCFSTSGCTDTDSATSASSASLKIKYRQSSGFCIAGGSTFLSADSF